MKFTERFTRAAAVAALCGKVPGPCYLGRIIALSMVDE